MPWGVAAAAAGVVGNIYSSGQAGKAAEDAASGQENAARLSAEEQKRLLDQQRRDSKPYRDSGYNALNQLNYLMGLGSPTAYAKTQDYFDPEAYKNWRIQNMMETVKRDFKNPDKQAEVIAKRTERINAMMADPSEAWKDYNARVAVDQSLKNKDIWKKRDATEAPSGEEYGFLQKRFNNAEFEKDPGYQFRMDEGNRAVQGGAAARGGLLSGAAMKAMQKYSQGFASNEYGNAYNRFTGDQQNMYNRLAGVAGTGQQQMNQTNQMQQNGLNNISQQYADAAAARASGIMGASNARQSGYQNAGNMLMDAYGQYRADQRWSDIQQQNDLDNYRYGQGGDKYAYNSDGMQTDYYRR